MKRWSLLFGGVREEFEKDWCQFFKQLKVDFTREAIRSWVSFWELFHCSLNLFACDRHIQNFCVLISFSSLFFSRNFFILSKSFNLLPYSCFQCSLIILFISYNISSNDLLFIPDCNNLSFFMISLAEGLSIFLAIFKDPAFGFIDFSLLFLKFCFAYFCCDLCYVFPLSALGLVCPFSGFLKQI